MNDDLRNGQEQPEQTGIPAREFEDVCAHSLGLIGQNREYLQMHLARQNDPRTRQALEDIGVETARLERALGSMMRLLNLSGNENLLFTGTTRGSRVELGGLLRAVDDMKDEIARQTGVRVEIRLPMAETDKEEQLWLNADPDSAEQVLFHLLSNALRASGSGDRVELSLRKEEGGYRLTVADRGCGLPTPENWKENRRRFLGGAKLGLPLCRAYCRQAGWELTLTSRPGGGTLAEVWMPAAEPTLCSAVELQDGAVTTSRLCWLLRRELTLCPTEDELL